MTWGPRRTLAALAATVLLAGSSCDNDAQYDPPPAQPTYLTQAPDDLHHAILVQGDSRPAPDWVRKHWEPVDSVRMLDKHAFEDRRLPPCTDGRPELLLADPYAIDTAYNVTLENSPQPGPKSSGRYIVARQLTVFKGPRGAVSALAGVDNDLPFDCGEYDGANVTAYDQTGHQTFEAADAAEDGEIAGELPGQETLVSSGSMATKSGQRLAWIQIVTRNNNALALTRVVDLKVPDTVQRYDYTEYRPGDVGLHDRVLTQHALEQATVMANHLVRFGNQS